MVAGLPKDLERGASKHRRIWFSFESFNRCKKHSVCFGDANDCTSRSALSPGGANNRSSAASCAGVARGWGALCPPPALSPILGASIRGKAFGHSLLEQVL